VRLLGAIVLGLAALSCSLRHDHELADLFIEGPDADAPEVPAPDAADPGPDVPVDTTCPERSYIWIANSAEGTLSKLCTITGQEMGRYATSPQGATGDPSRTSVNLHGDMVVTNGNAEPGPSSVTKFAAETADCIDRDGDRLIRTSTGRDDVLPWGEDECMIWNTPLGSPTIPASCTATAWQGDEDPDSGLGGHVWIGCMVNQTIYVLDGDSGTVVASRRVPLNHFGGAMDGRGHFWTVAMGCVVGWCQLARIDLETLDHELVDVPCGYGISVDGAGRIWTAGVGCINRHDPDTGDNVTARPGIMHQHYGVAVDDRGSVWIAEHAGKVVRVSEADPVDRDEVSVGDPDAVSPIVGVAVDFHGYVWAVSQGGNTAIKIDPYTHEWESFPVGEGPNTYSDMTGYQLSILY
jgi:hypothetical protein